MYNPSLNNTSSKSIGLYGPLTPDARSYIYDKNTFSYRPYQSTSEVLIELDEPEMRKGNFPIYINESGQINIYFFRNGISDNDLVPYDEYIISGDFTNYTITLTSNRGNNIVIPTNLETILDQFIVGASYDKNTTTLTLDKKDGSHINLDLDINIPVTKTTYYPIGNKDNINQVFSVGEPVD